MRMPAQGSTAAVTPYRTSTGVMQRDGNDVALRLNVLNCFENLFYTFVDTQTLQKAINSQN